MVLRMKMMKNSNYIQLRLISITLLISILITDYHFCSILDQWLELSLIFILFFLSIFLINCCTLFCYVNVLFSQSFTILLFFISYFFLKNYFFKETLILLFFFALIIFIISLVIYNKKKYTDSSFIVIDCLIILLGVCLYVILSLYTNFKHLKTYHLFSILFIQCFLVYPIIFILKKISIKCRNKISKKRGCINEY